MSDFDFERNDDVEKFLCFRIEQGNESSKLDFKTGLDITDPKAKAKIIKLMSAIANSDEVKYQGYGFIVLGYKTTSAEFVNCPDLEQEKLDGFCSKLDDFAHQYLDKVPDYRVCSFIHDDRLCWGAIVIPPSKNQPHIFKKPFDKDRLRIGIGDWFVRKGENNSKAYSEDYIRIQKNNIDRIVKPLENRIAFLEQSFKEMREKTDDVISEYFELSLESKLTSHHRCCCIALKNRTNQSIEIIEVKSTAKDDKLLLGKLTNIKKHIRVLGIGEQGVLLPVETSNPMKLTPKYAEFSLTIMFIIDGQKYQCEADYAIQGSGIINDFTLQRTPRYKEIKELK